MTRVGWLDLGCGVSGDMLLGALVDAGVPLALLEQAVASLGLPVCLESTRVHPGGLAATRITVRADEPGAPERHWRDIRELLDRSTLAPLVRQTAHAAFRALAEAEAAVHGIDSESVHFHEVGAHDAIADIVGAAAGLAALGVDTLVATPVALGGGTVRSAHGVLPVPVPAVLQLFRLAGAPCYGGPCEVELCTPTGAALVTTTVDSFGPMPELRIDAVGLGAGERVLADRANVVRLVVGTVP